MTLARTCLREPAGLPAEARSGPRSSARQEDAA